MSNVIKKKIRVLVFSIHIWYLAYPTDRSLDTFSCIFVLRIDKIEKSSKMLDNYLVDFLLIFYQKVQNFWLSKRHPLAATDVIQLNVPTLNSQFGNLFWTLFYNPDHSVLWRNGRHPMITNAFICMNILNTSCKFHTIICLWYPLFLELLHCLSLCSVLNLHTSGN